MEELPTELRRSIIQHLSLPSIKSLRLTSKAWASLGEEYLISPLFTTLPHRPDTQRLLSLSEYPKFSYRIQALKFNHGEINEYHARHNTYFLQYMRDPESRALAQDAAWSSYAWLKSLKEQHLPTSCDVDVLTKIFTSLPNLRSISVSLAICPFDEEEGPELLREIWRIPSTRLLPRVATTERFTNILCAVASSTSINSVKSLSHDRLPFEFFAQKPIIISLISTAFQTLTFLSLVLDYSDMPNNLHSSQAFQNLSHCLRSASSLRALSLSFQSRKKIDVNSLFLSFKNPDFVLGNLEEVKFEGINSTEIQLGDFLARHVGLRIVQLGGVGVKAPHQPANGGVHLREGSFGGLFARLRESIGGARLQVQGDLVGLASGERWVLDAVEDVERLDQYVID
jgi:hypothetical protein